MEVICKGTSVTPGLVRGRIFVGNTMNDFILCPKGAILVVVSASPDIVLAFDKIIGLVSIEGGITSHAAILAREYGMPCIVSVSGIKINRINGKKAILNSSEGELIIIKPN